MALIGVVIISALLMALAVTLGIAVRSDTQLRGAFASSVTGFYAAESGLNKGMGEYRNVFLDYNVPHGSDFDPRTLTIGDREVTYQMTQRLGNPPCEAGCVDVGTGRCTCRSSIIPSGELFAGLSAIQYRYIVNSQANNMRDEVEAGVGAEFLVGYIPLFQFVAFYKNDLEIAPGAPMNLEGRVHTNANLYLNADTTTLNVRDNPAVGVFTVQVTAGGTIYRGRKRNSNECTGQVFVDMLEDTNPQDSNLDAKEVKCTSGTDTREVPASELALWKGSMFSNLGNIAIPEPDIIKPPLAVSNGGTADPGVYWEKADLRIVLHLNQAGMLGGGPILPHSIDVLDATGAQDVARTNALRNFMMAAAWNNANSTYRGTMPIFYTDVPFAAGSSCAQGQPACANAAANSYVPSIPAPLPGPVANPNGRNTALAPGAYTEVMGNALGVFDLDYRRGGFYNRRESKWMLLLNINVRDLILWNQQNGEPFFATNDSSEGGIVIFATVAGPSSSTASNNYGVRVFGTADIPLPGGIGVSADPTGVTIASDQAIYVLGHFNRGVAGGGPARQPASLIGDSINVMSQNYWRSSIGAVCGVNCCVDQFCRDGQSVLNITDARRAAATTFVNAGVLGGVDTTPLNGGVGAYNGGLENYPRLHEHWGGRDLNYQGSFVSLGTPEHVNGIWCGTSDACNIYKPPNRNWNFDPGFNNAANLPPLTPRFVYVQQVLFTEDFK
jgi:hypothetical protein